MEITSNVCNDVEALERGRQNIVISRKTKNLTQASLAEEIDFSSKQIHNWETGKNLGCMLTYAKLEKVLGKSLEELFYSTKTSSNQDVLSQINDRLDKQQSLLEEISSILKKDNN